MKPTEEEITAVANRAEAVSADLTEDAFGFLDYEDGVRDALRWVLGKSSDPLERGP